MSEYLFGVKERPNEFACQKSIEFLETLCDIWPVKLEMVRAEQNNNWELVDLLKKEFKPIVEKSQGPLAELLRWRYLAKELYDSNAEVRAVENEACKNDVVRFINNWCFTSDPRLPPLGLPNLLPFVLWPKQEEFIRWVHDAYSIGRSWLAEKSRGWGITWILCAYYVWHWLYHDGFIGGFGSRDKDAVDKLGDPDTIFYKVRFLIYHLPQEMVPESYRGKSIAQQSSNDSYLRIVNPDRDSTIRGEGGDNIGAGGRASIYVIDESALVLHPEAIDDALSYTTNCRGDVSTVRGMNSFGEKRHSGRVRVYSSWFFNDPSKHKDWRNNKMPSREECPFLDHEYLDKGELIVSQELLIDYSRSVEDSFIPADWVRAAVDFDLPIEGERQSGFDIASGGENHSVYAFRVGPVLVTTDELNFDSVQESLEYSLRKAEDDKTGLFVYDQDGIGESVWGHIKFTERKLRFDMVGVHGNFPASDRFLFNDNQKAREKYRNKRAENWSNLRERFRKTFDHRKGIRMYDYSELISIPNDNKLITQLSQPKRVFGNKIAVENKEKMRNRGVKSPDIADAVVNAFADSDREGLVISKFNYQDGSGVIDEFFVDPESPIGHQYVAIVTTSEMMTYALGCWWGPVNKEKKPVLKIFCEFMEKSNEITKLVSQIKTVMVEEIKPIREWICNSEMIDGLENGRDSLWHLYRKEKAPLRKNYSHDYNTAIVIVNQMFANGIIIVHKSCERLMLQLASWRMEEGKPQSDLGFAMALCQLATRLRMKKEITIEDIKPKRAATPLYSGSQGRFGNTSKENVEDSYKPLYLTLAEKQVKRHTELMKEQLL